MKNNKPLYREFCQTEPSIPIFSKDWWLDAVCGEDNWDVAIVEKGGNIVATMPYYIRTNKIGLKLMVQPQLTQTLGPWISYPQNQKYEKKLSFDKQIINALLEQLPQYDYFAQNFHYSITNWLPFYWKGFQQTTRYTYIIDDLTNHDTILKEFSSAKRKNIRKSSQIVEVKFDLPADLFYNNHKMTLLKQGSKISYSFELFERIYKTAYEHNSGKTIYAVDKESNIHCALFVVWYEKSAYDLISTIDPDFRNIGAATLLVYEIIKYVSSLTEKFDFEGSMIEEVENSFRQFGAKQVPYFAVSNMSRRMAPLYYGRKLMRSLLGK